jgi:Nitrogenase molybdenum-iron protein, alpha and beta chains
MSQFAAQNRHACALGGLQSVLAIERAVPILHSGPGCGQRLFGAIALNNGGQGAGYIGGHSVPCTNVGEPEVIFGGEEKLKRTIDNALKVMDADLYVVMTGCTTEIVGDDAGGVVNQFRRNGKPVVYAEAGGFNGTNYEGHEIVLDALIAQYLQPADKKETGLVNIWSVVPFQDPMWVGNYREIENLLTEIGLVPNTIFGPGRGIKALAKVPQAQFNLLISPWVGLKTVAHLEEKFGTPYLHYPTLPVGPTETGHFLRTVGEYAGIAARKVEEVISQHENTYYYFVERSLEMFCERRIIPKRFITVADSFYSVGITRFLVNDMGLIPETQFITDGVLPEYHAIIEAELKNFHNEIKAGVVFSDNGGFVQNQIKKIKFREKVLLLGSTWDKALARQVKGFHLSVSMPVTDRFVLDSTYVGYHGALRLLEDIYTSILSSIFEN